MNFTVETLPKSGVWTAVGGDFVFPLSWQEKLDKTLDEAVVICYNSSVKRYKPNTPFRVTATDGTTSKIFLHKLAQDNSVEYPNGSNKYKHTFSFVEAIKYTEGVMCQTLTFTNTLASSLEVGYCVMGNWLEGGVSRPVLNAAGLKNETVVTPVYNPTYTIVNAKTACTNALAKLNTALGTNYELVQSYTGYNCVTGGTTITTADWEHSDTITIQNGKATITYDMHLKSGESYDSVWHFTVEINSISATYKSKNTKKWTIADVCHRMFNLAEPIFSATKPVNMARFYLSQTDETDLAKIIAPEFAISQSTLREQLQMVGGYIHAEPRVTNITVVNGKYRYEIGFDYYSKLARATLPLYHLQKTHTYDLSNYVTRIHTNARNIVNTVGSGTVITDPAKNTFKAVRAEQANVRISDANAIVKTFEPIYELGKVMCGIYMDDEDEQHQHIPLSPVDITSFCYEATEYDSILSTFGNQYPSKAFALRWERGQKNITQLYYQAPHSWNSALSPYTIANILSILTGKSTNEVETLISTSGNQLVFQVTYKPITNTAFIHGKNEYTEDEPYTSAYNQSDALVELSYYGQNIKGTAQRMGNPEMQMTFCFPTLASLPPLGGVVSVDGEEFYITTANYEMNSQRIFGTLSLTQDYNRLSEYIGINSQKRISEISTDQSYDREIIIPSTIILGERPSGYTQKTAVNYDFSAFRYIFGGIGSSRITQAQLFIGATANGACLPAVASGYGNVTVLTTSLKDNYSAGETENFVSSNDASITGYWQEDYRFGDYFGRAESLNIMFSDFIIDSAVERRNFAFSYPKRLQQPDTTPKAYLKYGNTGTPYYLSKDSRERLATIAFTFEIQTTLKGVSVGSAISSINAFCHANLSATPHLYLITENGEMPYKLDTDIIDYSQSGWVDLGTVSAVYDDSSAFHLATKTATADGKGFVIAMPVTQEVITVIDESGTTEQQTINKGGEIVLINSNPITNGQTLLGSAYTFYKE